MEIRPCIIILNLNLNDDDDDDLLLMDFGMISKT